MEGFTRFGNWEQEQRLGRGSYGEVTLWRNIVSKQRVAIKKCPLLKSDPPEKRQKIRERWENELRIMRTEVNLENIVRAVQVDSEFLNALNRSNPSGLPVLVMEYCDGGDLRKLLHNIKNSNGLMEYEVKNVLRALSSAISYLHDKGITHRDLKPENVVIKKNNDCNIYKVTDFGYAKDMINTNFNSQVGTVGYFAPEVLLNGKYSPTIDYWSMGIIAFEVICGCRPFIPHQTITKWANQLKSKERSTIAITENNTGQFEHHKQIFNENQISQSFKQMIEQWLILALDFSHKRGLPANVTGVPDEVRNSFFKGLDEILNKKILTIFCLSTYKFLSYEVSEKTTLDELLVKITTDTGIQPGNLFLIFTPEQNPEQYHTPVDLVLDRCNGPMCYATSVPNHFPNLKSAKPYMSKTINDFLSKSTELKAFYLLDFARQVLFFCRNENRHYVAFLNGLENYAMFLNHNISTRQSKIKDITSQYNQIFGALVILEDLLKHSKQKLEEKNIAHLYVEIVAKWESKAVKIAEDVRKLTDVCIKLEKRYESILRRSKETIDSTLFKTKNEDFFKMETLEKYYESLRRELNEEKFSKICPIEKSQAIMGFIYDTLKVRSNLLQCPALQDIQRTLSDIHVEYQKILDIKTEALKQIDKQSKEIKELIVVQQNDLCTIMENSAVEKFKRSQENIPDLDTIMSCLGLDEKQNGANTINFQLGPNPISSLTGMEISCFGEASNVQTIIEENEQIRTGLDHLLQDIDMNISMLRNPDQDFTSQS